MESNSGSTNASSFDLLDDDALLQVLLRCRGDDHAALGMTCKRLRETLLTSAFRRERADMEWAETETRIRNPKQDDSDGENDRESDSDYVVENGVDIIVDGRKAGEISFCLVNRENTRFFHEACDDVSHDLQVTGCTLFDTRGKPRVASIKEAIKDDDRCLLYIKRIGWTGQAYRRGSFVGAQALRSFLANPKLENKWAIAVYVPDPETQFAKEDQTTEAAVRNLHREYSTGSKKTKEDYEKIETWSNRCDELRNLDMQPFFRSGFLQVKETVRTSLYRFLFAVPSHLESPMLSKQETDSVEILEAPASKKRPTGVNNDFLRFMIRSSSEMRRLRSSVKENEGPPSEQRVRQIAEATCESQFGEQIREMKQKTEVTIRDCRRSVDLMEENVALFQIAQEQLELADGSRKRKLQEILEGPTREEMESRLGCAKDALREAESLLCKIEQTMDEERTKLVDKTLKRAQEQYSKAIELINNLNAKVREEISRFLNAGATIRGSNVLHACAANRMPEFIDALLEAVPQTERHNVINGRDHNGMTPLMCAAGASLCPDQHLLDTINKLIHVGANKDLVDEAGETAYGKFRQQKRSMKDFRNISGVRKDLHDNVFEVQITGALFPSDGATPADKAYDSSDGENDFNEDEDED